MYSPIRMGRIPGDVKVAIQMAFGVPGYRLTSGSRYWTGYVTNPRTRDNLGITSGVTTPHAHPPISSIFLLWLTTGIFTSIPRSVYARSGNIPILSQSLTTRTRFFPLFVTIVYAMYYHVALFNNKLLQCSSGWFNSSALARGIWTMMSCGLLLAAVQ